jgi:hypothetical protein
VSTRRARACGGEAGGAIVQRAASRTSEVALECGRLRETGDRANVRRSCGRRQRQGESESRQKGTLACQACVGPWARVAVGEVREGMPAVLGRGSRGDARTGCSATERRSPTRTGRSKNNGQQNRPVRSVVSGNCATFVCASPWRRLL